eukprot:6481542-Amphidinium_carterae.2
MCLTFTTISTKEPSISSVLFVALLNVLGTFNIPCKDPEDWLCHHVVHGGHLSRCLCPQHTANPAPHPHSSEY